MDKERIFPILDFILNDADADDLAAIQEALVRREKRKGAGGIDVQTLAKESSRSIEAQVGGSLESIRNMIRNYAVQMIEREVPDIPEEHLSKLIEAWIPDSGGVRPGRSGGERSEGIPKDALLTMIRQYLAYKTNTMRPNELQALVREINDWPQIYWSKFPQAVQRILTKYLKNEIDAELCWELIERSV